MKGIKKRKGVAALAAILLVMSATTSAVGATYFYSTNFLPDSYEPTIVEIKNPASIGSVLFAVPSEIRGGASDPDGEIQAVSIKGEQGHPVSAVLQSPEDICNPAPADDTSSPTVRISTPAASSTVITPTGAITVLGTASDNPGGSGIERVQVKVDGGSYFTANPISPGDWSSWNITINVASSGNHRITPRATDNEGNQAWGSIYVNVIIDSTAPSLSITNPAGGSTVLPGTLAVNGTASDIGSGVSTLQVRLDGGQYLPATPKAASDWSTWTASFNSLTEGDHTIYAKATDRAGNSRESPAVIKIKKPTSPADTVAPTVTASPAGGLFATSISVTLAAKEPATIYYTINGFTPTTSSQVYISPIAISTTTTLKYFARDVAGNIGAVVTQVYTIDTVAPTVTASPPGGMYSSGQSVTLTASEPSTIYYTTNGATPTTSSSVYSLPLSITSATTLSFMARDAAGNFGATVTQTYSIALVDSIDPAIAITQPAGGSEVIVTDGTITIEGIASDSGSGVRIVELRVDGGLYRTATPNAPGDWSTWSITMPITAGERRLVPRATDNAGNQAWNSIYITVVTDDSQVPPPPTPPSPGGDSSTIDNFGIAKIYPTAAGDGNEYYTRTNATTVTEFRDGGRVDRLPSGFSKNADGSWNIPAGSGPRWIINGGWRNVEMTMQLKINSGGLVQLYSNGEQHTTNLEGAWHGSANKMRVYADGRMGFIKELYHDGTFGNSGYTSEIATRNSGTAITGKWVTVKFVGYNINNDAQRKLEAYVSPNNDNRFIKVTEYIDSGSWSASSRFDSFMAYMRENHPAYVPENRDTGQDMRRNEAITWLGEWVSFRSDGADYDFRNVSVREIFAGNGPISSVVTDFPTMLVDPRMAYVEPEYHDD
ncbi:MAG: chitobiase/beta-hexosaminidase C-terminal domain-containing protein [Nitrososphaera sp.]|nr:chitobiase/beta-hexosaminidase C-terminal domain-containing protein [Nitrososphaera sp.]